MQFPITIGLHRSRFIGGGLLFLTILTGTVTLCYPRSTEIQASILLVLFVIAWLSWRRLAPSLAAIRLERDGQILISRPGEKEFFLVELLPGATVHPWLTVLALKSESGAVYALITTVDSFSAEDFRRLRVFLRWRVSVSASRDAA